MSENAPQHPSALVPASVAAEPVYDTDGGQLYEGDALPLLRALPGESVDMVFADPPFNLDKDYGEGVSDDLEEGDYLQWSRRWLTQCVRVLKPGGALFAYNLPQWLIHYGHHLEREGMEFRHWIALRMPKGMPRGKRMSAAHYGCLYYTKGEPRAFNRQYVPIPTCRHCDGEIRDYGGHRKKLNERGLNMMDVVNRPEEAFAPAPELLPRGQQAWAGIEDLWDDVPVVRHGRYKMRNANELAPIFLERVIGMATDPGDLVVDPFAGTGTAAYAAEKLGRRWLSVELASTAAAIRRLEDYRRGEDEEWESARGNLASRPSPESSSGQMSLWASSEEASRGV